MVTWSHILCWRWRGRGERSMLFSTSCTIHSCSREGTGNVTSCDMWMSEIQHMHSSHKNIIIPSPPKTQLHGPRKPFHQIKINKVMLKMAAETLAISDALPKEHNTYMYMYVGQGTINNVLRFKWLHCCICVLYVYRKVRSEHPPLPPPSILEQ